MSATVTLHDDAKLSLDDQGNVSLFVCEDVIELGPLQDGDESPALTKLIQFRNEWCSEECVRRVGADHWSQEMVLVNGAISAFITRGPAHLFDDQVFN